MSMDLLQIDEDFFNNLKRERKGEDFYFPLNFFSINLNLKKEIVEILSKKFKNEKSKINLRPKIFHSPIKEFKKTKKRPYVYDITFIENNKDLIFYAYNFASILNLKNPKKCTLILGKEKYEKIASEIENFLRVYSAIILPSFNSLILHSSAVLLGDKALIFLGPSGAGKSTIAKLFLKSKFKTLSDDLNILNIQRENLWVSASPFLSEIKRAEGGKYEVEKIFYLNKSNENSLSKIPKLRQRAYLFTVMPVLNSLKYFQKGIFSFISKVLDLKEVEVLNFKKDEEIVRWLKSI